MFTELQEKWLKDLETTGAKQCKEYLHSDSGYCCLGRACEVVDPSGWEVSGFGFFEYKRHDKSLPLATWKQLNLRDSTGGFAFSVATPYGQAYGLANLNDECGYTFKQIAAIMRKYPWLVFTNFEIPDGINSLTIEERNE